jgi:hypothetical protein
MFRIRMRRICKFLAAGIQIRIICTDPNQDLSINKQKTHKNLDCTVV